MEYLREFERKIFLLDGMLIETGGWFGEKRLDYYIDSCLESAEKYYEVSRDKSELLRIVDLYIEQYRNETQWKYYHYEMRFLNTLRSKIEEKK